MTGASVAASTTAVGNAMHGGDWQLDHLLGFPQTPLPFSNAAMAAYPAVLATISVSNGGGADFTTIQAAVNNASPGDLIEIQTGTYAESVDLALMGSVSGSPGTITITTAAAATVTVDGGAGPAFMSATSFVGTVTLDGMTLDRDTGVNTGVSTNKLGGVVSLTDLDGTLIITDNTFSSGFGGHGVLLFSSASLVTHLLFDGNTSAGTGGADGGGDFVHAETSGANAVMSIVVNDNDIDGGTADAVQIIQAGSQALAARVTNNLIDDTGVNAIAISVAGSGGSSLLVDGNTIDSPAADGIDVFVTGGGTNKPHNVVVSDNTITNTAGFPKLGTGIDLSSASTLTGTLVNASIDNNTVSGASSYAAHIRPENSAGSNTWNVGLSNNSLLVDNVLGLDAVFIDVDSADASYALDLQIQNNTATGALGGTLRIENGLGGIVELDGFFAPADRTIRFIDLGDGPVDVSTVNRASDLASLLADAPRGSFVDPDNDQLLWNADILADDSTLIVTAEAQLFRAYRGGMGREPDDEGFDWWLNEINAGRQDLRSMTTGFVLSSEFRGLTDSNGDGSVSNGEFLDHVYRTVFGRLADPDGFCILVG